MTEDSFFIGWLPVPGAYRRFQFFLIAVILISSVGLAMALALRQRDPGPALWSNDMVRTFDGTVLAHPYAMLLVAGSTPAEATTTYLLVENGKFGAVERVTPFARRAVRITGTLLERDGRKMVELVQGEPAIRPIDNRDVLVAANMPTQIIDQQVTLAGEIIDPKCYLGAMKPGGGKTHKACAMLCISGGVPPMLVTRDAAGRESYYLLTTDEGGPAATVVMPYVGDQVTVHGQLERLGDLLVLGIGSKSIARR